MGLRDAFVQLGVVTPQNCQMTKNPKLGVRCFFGFFLLVFTMEADVFQIKEEPSLAAGKVHQALQGTSYYIVFFFPKTLQPAPIHFLVPTVPTYTYIHAHTSTVGLILASTPLYQWKPQRNIHISGDSDVIGLRFCIPGQHC